MKKLDSRGFSLIETILVIAVLMLIGVVGWYVFSRSDTTREEKKSQGDSSLSETDGNEYLEIKEWGVRFAVPESIDDLTYEIGTCQSRGLEEEEFTDFACLSFDSASLETKGMLEATGPETTDGMGSLLRTPPGLKWPMVPGGTYDEQEGAKKIGDFVYYYDVLHAADGFLQSAEFDDLMQSIVTTLEAY